MASINEFPSKPDIGSQELTEEIIRLRAYQLFEKRGFEHGHELEDWLHAEAEVMGNKPAELSAPAEAQDLGKKSDGSAQAKRTARATAA